LVRNQEVASDLTDFSRLLLAMEIRGAKTYWHMLPKSVFGNTTDQPPHPYPPEFEENYMIGNVGMLDVAANTWFGTDPLYIHMINAIPITAVTNILFDENYVKYEYPYLMDSRSSVEMAWRGYTTCIYSIINPNQAWEDAQSIISYELDSALSKSQVLYFISQQPGYVASPKTNSANKTNLGNPPHGSDVKMQPSSKKNPSSSSSSSCESHPDCVASGLSGECCPTSQNMFLDCCSS
jgi:hypothetical protein